MSKERKTTRERKAKEGSTRDTREVKKAVSKEAAQIEQIKIENVRACKSNSTFFCNLF